MTESIAMYSGDFINSKLFTKFQLIDRSCPRLYAEDVTITC